MGSGCCTAEISGIEVVPVAALDKDRAQQVLSEILSGPKDTEWDKAKVSLGTTLCNAIIRAAVIESVSKFSRPVRAVAAVGAHAGRRECGRQLLRAFSGRLAAALLEEQPPPLR